MGDFEENLIMVIIHYFLRWLFSNEKNREAKVKRIEKKKQESEAEIDSNTNNSNTFRGRIRR